MILKLGIEHQGLNVYKVCINDDPWLTLTYLTTMSNFAKFTFCAVSRTRYQIRINRIIGPLFFSFDTGMVYSNNSTKSESVKGEALRFCQSIHVIWLFRHPSLPLTSHNEPF